MFSYNHDTEGCVLKEHILKCQQYFIQLNNLSLTNIPSNVAKRVII